MKDEKYGLVSIIVPVYNTEKYLHRCIDSILGQSYRNLEVILVDDGSYDNSKIICAKYAVIDKRIKVICQENAGVSIARNTGLDVAEGKYICFVDSDDYIDSELIYDNLKLLNDTNADIVCFNRMDVYGNNKLEKVLSYSSKLNTLDIIKGIYLGTLSGNVTDKMFKTLVTKDARFPGYLKSAEDIHMMTSILKNANKIIGNDKCYYYYDRTNEQSITHTQKVDTYWYDFLAVDYRANVAKAKDGWKELYFIALKDCFKYALKCHQYDLFHSYLNDAQGKYLKDFFKKNKKYFKITNLKERIMLEDYYNLGIINLIKGVEYFFKAFKKGMK